MSLLSFLTKTELPKEQDALVGREEIIFEPRIHYVNKNEYPVNTKDFEKVYFGMGCFWGAEKYLWELEGVLFTSVGYGDGFTRNPTYEEVCSGQTAHNEIVEVIYDPKKIKFSLLLKVFWENHDPTQGMRQGYDVGTQYRSGIYITNEVQMQQARETKDAYGSILVKNGFKSITTDIKEINNFFFAEEYHQQYLAKNPGGYCGHGGCGIKLNLD